MEHPVMCVGIILALLLLNEIVYHSTTGTPAHKLPLLFKLPLAVGAIFISILIYAVVPGIKSLRTLGTNPRLSSDAWE